MHFHPVRYSDPRGPSATRRSWLKHTWANLVPLTAEMNREVAQGLYEAKRAKFRADSMYSSARRLAERNESWDADAIRARSDRIIDWAIKRWPRGE